MTGSSARRAVLLQRPRIQRIAPAYTQRLPAGRALVKVSVSGWGLLYVERAYLRPYWSAQTVCFAVPLAETLRVTVFSLLGRDHMEIRPEATLPQGPESASGPAIAVDVPGAPIRGDLGRGIAARVPRLFDVPAPALPAVVPNVSTQTRLPIMPMPVESTVAVVRMPSVRRAALWPPQTPADGFPDDSH